MTKQIGLRLSEHHERILMRRVAKLQEDVPEKTVQPGQVARYAVEKYLDELTEDQLKVQ